MSSSDAGTDSGNGNANSTCSSAKTTDDSTPSLPFVLVNFIPIPNGQTGKSVNDLENFIGYSSNWDVKIVPQEGKPSPGHTEHSTAVVGSTIQYSFTGTQIIVLGLLPPGDGPLSADYSIDGGPSVSKSQETLSGPQLPVGNATFFTSPTLEYGDHTIDIVVTQTGQGRNYTFDYFEVITPPTTNASTSKSASRKNDNVKAIVGGVIGGVAFLSFLLLIAILVWKRRGHRIKAKLPFYRQSRKAASSDAIQPFITTPSMAAPVQYRNEPKLAPQMRVNSVESLTYRGSQTPIRSAAGGAYSETVFSAVFPIASNHVPEAGQRSERTPTQSEGKLLPPLPRYTGSRYTTNQSIVDGILSIRESVGSNDISDFTHFTAARASSGIGSPELPSPEKRESHRSAGTSMAEE